MGILTLSLLTAVWLARRGGTWMPALLSVLGLLAGGYLYTLVGAGF